MHASPAMSADLRGDLYPVSSTNVGGVIFGAGSFPGSPAASAGSESQAGLSSSPNNLVRERSSASSFSAGTVHGAAGRQRIISSTGAAGSRFHVGQIAFFKGYSCHCIHQ